MKLERYDFSEPQHGKDACDREAAYIKRRYQEYLNKNPANKVSNAKQLVEAIMSDGGPKNSKAIILSIDKAKTKLSKKCAIKNISFYHSYEPKEDGIVFYEYYNVGQGKFHSFVGVELQSVVIKSDWFLSSRQDMNLERSSQQSLFMCRVQQCKSVFFTENDLLEHQSKGEHTLITPKSTMDKVKEIFVEQKNVHFSDFESVAASCINLCDEITSNQLELYNNQYMLGWARPYRKSVKFSEKQKTFVKNLFEQGERSKQNKKTANQISDLMKLHKENGQPYFSAQEQLSVSQIKGLIRRFTVEKQKKLQSTDYLDDIETDQYEVRLSKKCVKIFMIIQGLTI